MNVTVDFQNAATGEVPAVAHFQQWAEAALQSLAEDCEISIRVVDEQESAQLNHDYRGRQGPTNVLSFPFDSPVPLVPRLLGDLVICAGVVGREAQQQGKTVADHWAHMVVHGCLHLLGHDHIEDDEADRMEALEVEILQSLDIANPYIEQGGTS